MFFLKDEEHTVSLHPSYFGPMVRKYLVNRLIEDVEGKHNGEYYVLAVLDNIDYSEGKVTPGTGQGEYKIHYRAIVFKPFRGEVVDGMIETVAENGMFVDVGPLSCFVARPNIPSGMKYNPNATPPSWIDEDGRPVGRGQPIRIKITGLRTELGGKMFGIGTIKEDYLGPIFE